MMIERERSWEDDEDDVDRERDEEGWSRHDDEERSDPDPYQEYIRSEEAQFAREHNRRMT